jgi:hypothetical protein
MQDVLCGIACTELVSLVIPEVLVSDNGLHVGLASLVLPIVPATLVRGLGLSPRLRLVLGPSQLWAPTL